jgi:2-polyprenyl-3-methyl-5-hydroxy-6-metoxy-1,4-benzoquinol methylase
VSACHLCGFDGLSLLPSYEALHRVTSDCKPWPPGGQLAVCRRCGGAQAIISTRWREEADDIYSRYTIYHQGNGVDQAVFDTETGAASRRSLRLFRRLKEELPLPPRGRLLDVGCGTGATLRAFNEISSGWSLVGFDIDDSCNTVVESIPGVEALYTGTIEEVPGQFEVLTLIHSLEHIAEPVKFLTELRQKLGTGGMLVVQVPDCWRNPFMFLVADHATHFFLSTLRDVVIAAGYDVVVAADDWIAKELTLVARRSAQESPSRVRPNTSDNLVAVRRRIDWVAAFGEQIRGLAAQHAVGILGTSIAGTWVQEELRGAAAFFVDEDPSRFGRTFMGRQILPPKDVPPGSWVIVALPTPIAEQVRIRLAQVAPNVNWLVPRSLPE